MVMHNTSSVRALVYSIVRITDPVIAVDLGIHHADSLLLIASAMRTSSTIYGFDLFSSVQDGLPFRKSAPSKELAERNVFNEYERLRRENIERGMPRTDRVLPHIYIANSDFVKAADSVAFTSLLHVNVCSHDQNVREILKVWIEKVDDLVILEGGKCNECKHEHRLGSFSHILDETWIMKDWRSIVMTVGENEYISVLTRR